MLVISLVFFEVYLPFAWVPVMNAAPASFQRPSRIFCFNLPICRRSACVSACTQDSPNENSTVCAHALGLVVSDENLARYRRRRGEGRLFSYGWRSVRSSGPLFRFYLFFSPFSRPRCIAHGGRKRLVSSGKNERRFGARADTHSRAACGPRKVLHRAAAENREKGTIPSKEE